MYLDPSGESFILACIIIGAIIGAAITYIVASNAGYEGMELILLTVLGAVAGGIAGYLAAPYISSFLGSSFTFGFGSFIGGGSAAVLGISSTITITGTQIAVATGVMAGIGYLFARTSKSNGYWAEKYLVDHSPDHIHLKGTDNSNIRIDKNGNPLKGDGKLNPQQRRALKDLWKEILKLFEEVVN